MHPILLSLTFTMAVPPPNGRFTPKVVCALLLGALLLCTDRGDEISPFASNEQWGQWEDLCLDAMRSGRASEGKEVARKLVDSVQAALPRADDTTAAAIHWLAYFTQECGEMEQAEKLWRRALELDEQFHGVNSLETSRRLLMLGSFYRKNGDFARARSFLARAYQIRQEKLGPDHVLTASALRAFGEFTLVNGELGEAETCLKRAASILQKHANANDPFGEQEIWLCLANIYIWIGDLDKADQCVGGALKARNSTVNADDLTLTHVVETLAEIHAARMEFSKAENSLAQLIAVFEKQELDSSQQERLRGIRERLGYLYLQKNDTKKAEAILVPAARDVIKGRPLALTHRIASLVRLAELRVRQNDRAAGERLIPKMEALLEAGPAASPPDALALLSALASLQVMLGKPEEATRLANRLQDYEERQLQQFLTFSSEEQRLASLRILSEQRYSLWASIGAVEPLARAVLRTKGLVLDSLIEDRALAEDGKEEESRELFSRINMAQLRLSSLSEAARAPSNEGSQNPLTFALRESDGAEAALAEKFSRIKRRGEAFEVTLEAVQRAIPPKTVMIEFVRYRPYRAGEKSPCYGALLFFKNYAAAWVPLGPCDRIDRSIKLYRHALDNPPDNAVLETSLGDLYAALWQPIVPALPSGIQNAILSPDDQLSFVSFAALAQPSGRFLSEDLNISYISSARDLLERLPLAESSRTLAIWAAPAFDAPSPAEALGPTLAVHRSHRSADRAAIRGLLLEPLAGARWEGQQLKDKATAFGFKECLLFSGAEATEASFRSRPSANVLHIATHGFLLPERLEPTGNRPNDYHPLLVTPQAWRSNPMLRTGFALAGALASVNAWNRGEVVPAEADGFVTAEEVAALDLRGTELVVLSACETGSGEAQSGEGMLGLRRGFIEAGVENLLLTLWSVDDRQTPAFMLDFYRNLCLRFDPATALAVTQRGWLARLRREQGIAPACRCAGPFVLSFRGQKQPSGSLTIGAK